MVDNCKGHTYVGTLKSSHQHTPGATRTSLGPLVATFLGHNLDTKPAQNIKVWGRLRSVYWSSWASSQTPSKSFWYEFLLTKTISTNLSAFVTHQTGTHIPHPLCRESYHLGAHVGTIWGWIGGGLGGFLMFFSVVLEGPIKQSL